MADPAPEMGDVAAVVLAAGAGRRFGGSKLLAELDGRPLICHAVEALRASGIAEPILVVPPGRNGDALARVTGARAVINPSPGDGLASSVRVGVRAAAAIEPPVRRIVIVLADQPRLRSDVITSLVRHAATSSRPLVVPRYESGGGRNPVIVERSAFGLVDSLVGDRGLDPMIRRHPELVDELPVRGSNPDVDTRDDLAALIAVTG